MNSTWLHVTADEKAKVERTLVLKNNQARGFVSRLGSHKGVWIIFASGTSTSRDLARLISDGVVACLSGIPKYWKIHCTVVIVPSHLSIITDRNASLKATELPRIAGLVSGRMAV